MTSFADEAEAAKGVRGPDCTIGQLPERYPDDGPEIYEVIETRHDITHAGIARAARARGVNISESGVGRHRRRDCLCPTVS
ncbi:MAG: hypothetical protein DWQ40_00350 [Actinobacteria bacterium]|nr:MAG: hypothetical protein DWQ40_00350 [Actinomycetota bacterium]REK35580.1 MAG: hypothetical protein DWQ20_06035 [Actinomycetota bacterium]